MKFAEREEKNPDKYENKLKSEIEGNDEKICSRFSYKISHKIEFTAHSRHRDHPPAWVFISSHHVNRSCEAL